MKKHKLGSLLAKQKENNKKRVAFEITTKQRQHIISNITAWWQQQKHLHGILFKNDQKWDENIDDES